MFRTDRRKQVVSSDWLIQLPVSKAWNSECRLASASIHNDINKSDQRAGKALQWSCRSITWKRSIHKSLSDHQWVPCSVSEGCRQSWAERTVLVFANEALTSPLKTLLYVINQFKLRSFLSQREHSVSNKIAVKIQKFFQDCCAFTVVLSCTFSISYFLM